MRREEQEVRARARELLADLDAFKATFAAVRRALLAEPGVDLLATKIRRRLRSVPIPGKRFKVARKRVTERLDLVRYRPPAGPRRASWWIVRWASGWEYTPYASPLESRLAFDGWGALPAWHRAPLLIEEADREEPAAATGRSGQLNER